MTNQNVLRRLTVLTLFPNLFDGFVQNKALKRLRDDKNIALDIVDIRDFADGCYRAVDDSPYGGGAGLILRCVPVFRALDAVDAADAYVIAVTPSGKRFDKTVAAALVGHEHVIIICGHFEGMDERIFARVDAELSMGDFVLTGGELPAQLIGNALITLAD